MATISGCGNGCTDSTIAPGACEYKGIVRTSCAQAKADYNKLHPPSSSSSTVVKHPATSQGKVQGPSKSPTSPSRFVNASGSIAADKNTKDSVGATIQNNPIQAVSQQIGNLIGGGSASSPPPPSSLLPDFSGMLHLPDTIMGIDTDIAVAGGALVALILFIVIK